MTEAGFAAMTRTMLRPGGRVGVPVGCVLEGGYALERAGAVGGGDAGGAERAAVGDGPLASGLSFGEIPPVARQARERLAEWWPALG